MQKERNFMSISLLELAEKYLEEHAGGVAFSDLWEHITKEAGLTEEEVRTKIARFYTNFMLDGRFVTLGENIWELRSRLTFDKVHIDMKDVYNDVETNDDDEEESEEKEYNEAFIDKESNDDEDAEMSEDELEKEPSDNEEDYN